VIRLLAEGEVASGLRVGLNQSGGSHRCT